MKTIDATLEDRLLADKYFTEFGENQRPMAASYQSLLFCGELIRSENITTILDAGSGLSSVYFHLKFDNVLSVDDDAGWADKTRAFVSDNINKSIVINPLTSVKDEKFDFVFYDYGNIETRIYYFLTALEMSRRFFYIDDVHVSYYREYIHAKCKKYNLKFLPATMDQYGRYGALIIK
jgi:hypothetical protein